MPEIVATRAGKTGELSDHNGAIQGQFVPAAFAPKDGGHRRTFSAMDPNTGEPTGPQIEVASVHDVDAAATAAWAASGAMQGVDGPARASMLEAMAGAIAALGEPLVALARRETGLSAVRIVAERERLVTNLRRCAELAASRSLVDASIDTAEPSRRPLPKPDMRRMRRPIGPVAVFGPANQPLTGGALGADSASALAAGCPVIIKSHPEHPMTDALIARAAMEGARAAGAPEGLITLLHADALGEADVLVGLVRHACVRGIAFTGSRRVADEVADVVASYAPGTRLCASIGTINPVFVLPGAIEAGGASIAERLFQACTNVAGQTCTRPSVVVAPRGGQGESFAQQLSTLFDQMPAARMRSLRLRTRYLSDIGRCLDARGVRLEGGSHDSRDAGAGGPAIAHGCLLRTGARQFAEQAALHEEVFGPAMLLVMADGPEEVVAAGAAIGGALTGSIWMGSADGQLGRRLASLLEHRVGRLVFNATPTGLELCHALVHGGPYPASLGAARTAVGPDAAARWMRDVCYQNAPEAVLPRELRGANPLGLTRVVNGVATPPADREGEKDTGEGPQAEESTAGEGPAVGAEAA